jgi:photosystem II stability/assembly factor-like uncharacterized protein
LRVDSRTITILRVNSTLMCLAVFLASSCLAQQYRIAQSNTSESLRGLSTPTSRIAWASGTHGTYLRSMDGGISWRSAQVPGSETLDFRSVSAFDAKVAYLLSAGPGDRSRIYKTVDAGTTWKLQFTNHDPQGFFDCMAFWDRDHGIALGDPVGRHFALLTTENGGGTWNPVPAENLPAAIDGEGVFAASGTCITVEGKNHVWFATGGRAARVFRSADRGRAWQVADTPMLHGEDSSGIFSIAFRDQRRGVIAGGDYKQASKGNLNLAFTEDGGATWKLQTLLPGSFVSAVAFSRKHGLLAVGSAQAAYAGTTRQSIWTRHWDLSLNQVRFNSPSTAIAVGPKGAIVRFMEVP